MGSDVSEYVKLVVFVPEIHADAVREALGTAGAGKIGNYSFASFSSNGTGRFKPESGAHPAVGSVGTLAEVSEVRIEVLCERSELAQIVAAMKRAHPYEEVAYDIYPMEQHVRRIEERNQRVAGDKAWETSWTRRIILTVGTYAAIGIYLYVIGIERAWIHAIVPAIAFMISTLMLPSLKRRWLSQKRQSPK